MFLTLQGRYDTHANLKYYSIDVFVKYHVHILGCQIFNTCQISAFDIQSYYCLREHHIFAFSLFFISEFRT